MSCGPTNRDGTTWGQTFAYDPFGNISKSVPPSMTGISWLPGYNTNNRYTLGGTSYDGNGNLTADTFNTYAWDADANTIGINLGGSSPINVTYDAFDRIVEGNNSGTYKQILYSPIGKLALMAGQNTNNIFLPLPGGEQATYTGNTIRFRHYDWLGSARFESNMAEQEYGDVAYAPFGETYSIKNTPYLSFTGQQQDTVSGTYDFLYREYNPVQGRWISPDPAGLPAVNLANPQSWNRYAYALNNPLSYTDPLGLWCYYGTTGDDGSIDLSNTDAADSSNYDLHSNVGECGENGGQWYPDPVDRIDVNGGPAPQVGTTDAQIRKQNGCIGEALLAAGVAFGQTFVPLPPEAEVASALDDPQGFALDIAKQGTELLKNPGVRAVVLTDVLRTGKTLLPAVADALDFVPGLDIGVGLLQAGWGAYQGSKAYSETFKKCMGNSD